jgi:hypothetical protein
LSFQNLGQQHYIFIMEVIKGPRLWWKKCGFSFTISDA